MCAVQLKPETPPLATRRVWKKTALQTLNSRFHMDVSEKLHFMGVAHEDEFVTEDGAFSIDIAVTGPNGPIAVEVDGPYHFTINTLNPIGGTLIRSAAPRTSCPVPCMGLPNMCGIAVMTTDDPMVRGRSVGHAARLPAPLIPCNPLS